MKVTLRLVPEEEAMEFVADDFQLRFKVSRLLKRIEKVVEQESDGYFSLLFNDNMEEDIFFLMHYSIFGSIKTFLNMKLRC